MGSAFDKPLAYASADHLVSLALQIKTLAADYEDALGDNSKGADQIIKRKLQDYQNACEELSRVTQIRNIMIEGDRVCIDSGSGYKFATGGTPSSALMGG